MFIPLCFKTVVRNTFPSLNSLVIGLSDWAISICGVILTYSPLNRSKVFENLRPVVRSERSDFTTKLLVSEVGFWSFSLLIFGSPFLREMLGNWLLITNFGFVALWCWITNSQSHFQGSFENGFKVKVRKLWIWKRLSNSLLWRGKSLELFQKKILMSCHWGIRGLLRNKCFVIWVSN